MKSKSVSKMRFISNKMISKVFLLLFLAISSSAQILYTNQYWTPEYPLIGAVRVVNSPFQPPNPIYGGSIAGASKEMTRLAQQMTTLVKSVQSDHKAVTDVISGHNRRMTEIARQMTELAKSVADMATSLSNAAREMADLVRDGEERQKIRNREMTTTAVNLAELAKRMAAENETKNKCEKDKQ